VHDRAVTHESGLVTIHQHSDKADVIDYARAHGVAVMEGRARVEKFWADDPDRRGTPYEVVESPPNLFLTAGITLLWNLVSAAGGSAFGSGAYLGVGDSSTAASAGQTDLVASTNKVRFAVSGAPTVSTNPCTWSGTANTSTGNFAWAECGVFNASTSGTMLNRLVSSLGTKTNTASWTLALTLSIS
jgi:hypothetical protein